MYCYIWSYVVRPECVELFRQAYGPSGEWVQFFQRNTGYVRTDLLIDRNNPDRFLTIDHWSTQRDFATFRERFRDKFDAIDHKMNEWTVQETHLGDYEVLD